MSMDPHDLDTALNSDSQNHIRHVVRSLPADSLSLAWRSELNERLLRAKPQPRWRGRVAYMWKPVTGLALAGCLALTMSLRTSMQHRADSSGFEASLVNAYDHTSRMQDLTGAGLGMHEVGDITRDSGAAPGWTESDLSAL